MILHMSKIILILSAALMAGACSAPVAAAAQDKVIFLQDENFFLQDEIKKLQAELVDKDNAFKKLLLERETARYDLGLVIDEKKVLEGKIGVLQKMMTARDEELLRNAELAALPYRSKMEAAVDQLKAVTMALEEKNAQMMKMIKEDEALQQKVGVLTAEKMSLLQSIKKISAEYDDLKARVDGEAEDARAEADAKVRDFQVRLAAEQKLVQEKISQAKKPLETRIEDMEAACQTREARALQEGKLGQALLQEKVRKLEQQIVLLRENSGLEIKKAQDAAAAEIKGLKDRLNACSQGLQAVKK